VQQSHSQLPTNGHHSYYFPTTSKSRIDPVEIIEQFDEYLDNRTLSDYEIFASLTSVLKDTAQDWWVNKKRNVHTLKQFKVVFLCSVKHMAC